jgi:hypothetical protein
MRAIRAQRKLAQRLAPNGSRPKGMHRKTFERIQDRIWHLDMKCEDIVDAFRHRWEHLL